ncbi:MAG: heme lyase CcmF/NrfE family subunit [Proteobacteria bacterium]|nr:heme lyase CcmF/NrfE family subunit [Pseudomonadota bacterium]
MIVDIGYFSLLAAMVLSIYGMLTSFAGIKQNDWNLILSARYTMMAIAGMVFVAYLVLTYAFITDDFSVRFVAEHSSTDLPIFYKSTGVWGGMEGSLLLWQAILSIYGAIVAFRYHDSNRAILPHTLIILNTISLFLLFLLVGWSNPFARLIPTPLEGEGLNPLLQNIGMVIHPPLLYLGFVGLSIPFAFAMGSLMSGRLNNEWVITTRRWTLIAWVFLSAGIGFGGQWAYIELGWGGYWAWDPVENSSLMPWLTSTAFLHSVIVQEKRNRLKVWNMILIITTFSLTILGTFITRSGVLNSVHAFAKSAIGPAFLVFIAFTLIYSLTLLFLRQDLLNTSKQDSRLFSKENSFLINNVLFIGMAFTVLYGTVFPLLAEGLADKKLSIQAPFFNSIMAPMVIFTILLMGFTQFLGWKQTSKKLLKKNSLIPTITTLLLMIALTLVVEKSWVFTLMVGVSYFAAYHVIVEIYNSFKIKPSVEGDKKVMTSKFFLNNNRRRGAAIVHLGMLVLMAGICGNYFGIESSFSFYPGETKVVGDYVLEFNKIETSMERNAQLTTVRIKVFKKGEFVTELTPAKAVYPTSQQPMTEVSIYRTVLEDLYSSVATINDDGSATVNIYVNPLVNFIWLSGGFVVIGILFSLTYRSPQLKATRATLNKITA